MHMYHSPCRNFIALCDFIAIFSNSEWVSRWIKVSKVNENKFPIKDAILKLLG